MYSLCEHIYVSVEPRLPTWPKSVFNLFHLFVRLLRSLREHSRYDMRDHSLLRLAQALDAKQVAAHAYRPV